jgi:hypothetical protein
MREVSLPQMIPERGGVPAGGRSGTAGIEFPERQPLRRAIPW